MKITTLLFEKFNKNYSISGGQVCPECGKNTFSINSDDSLAKCFHSECEYYLTEMSTPNSHKEKINSIMFNIFRIFRKQFLSNTKSKAKRFCLYDRKITQNVLNHALIGEVCPLSDLIQNEINEALVSIKNEIETLKNCLQVKSGKKKKEANEKRMEVLMEQIKQIKKIKTFCQNVNNYVGWLVTAFTDEKQNIMSFNLRNPEAKEFSSLKPFKNKGLFGITLDKDFLNEKDEDKSYMFVEGEFNTLQWYSYLEREGIESGFISTLSIGGASAPDFDTIKALGSNAILCYDNDDAGGGCVKKFYENLNFRKFTVPSPNNDLDDYLKPSNKSNKSNVSFETLKSLIENALFIEMDCKKSIELVNNARSTDAPKHIRDQETSDSVLRDLKEKGRFYKSLGNLYFLRYVSDRVYVISPKNTEFNSILINYYRLNAKEDTCKYILGEISNECLIKGKEVKTSSFSHYSESDNSVFIFNQKDTVFHVKADGSVRKSKNGENDILFLQTEKTEPFDINLKAKFGGNPLKSLLFREIFDKGNFKVKEEGLSHHEYTILFLLCFYTMLLLNKFKTRPLVCLIGEKGSGKTTICKNIGMLIYGSLFNVTAMPKKEEDFDSVITNAIFQVIDNLESASEFLMDRLAVISTGGVIKKRKLYSDNTLCEFQLNCMMHITSRTARFNRDDIADRSIPFYFDRLEEKGFSSEGQMKADLLGKRDEIMSEIVLLHIPFILKAIEEFKDAQFRSNFRMAEFAEFATSIFTKLGKKVELDHILSVLSNSQTEFALKDSPLFELLDIYITRKTSVDQKNTLFEIYNITQSYLADSRNIMPFKSTYTFASHFMNNLNALKKVFIIDFFKGRANRKEYSIRRIEGGGENLQATLTTNECFSLEDSMNLFKEASGCSTESELIIPKI